MFTGVVPVTLQKKKNVSEFNWSKTSNDHVDCSVIKNVIVPPFCFQRIRPVFDSKRFVQKKTENI